MKKTIKFMSALLCVLALAACSAQPKENTNQNPGNDVNISDNGAQETPKEESKEYFGRVESVAGNEIELQLAQTPGITDGNNEGSAGGMEGETAIGGVADGGGSDATAKDPVTESPKKLSEMIEYSGENKSFILPAGITINSLSGGKADLTSIRKGSVILIQVDEAGNVTACEIWES
ncbi:hypothetical protein [Dielma fastidiosa]|uniref:hypothetical protein n=1 Tax=Dielma fastidiosa TaxID=1034346 RepID=UPI000E48713A|nr:hypothetical protein [Dielma fastidiosa]RHN01672.1 hypothetical protein DWZ33_06680 [Dielma fastidiosa]